jgi:predicted nucleotidyltransferase
MQRPEFPPDLYTEIPDLQTYETILLAYRGSVAHGTWERNTEPNSIDDIDLMGVAVPGLDHYFGLEQYGSRGTREIVRDPWDIVLYEARKVISLLMKGNPNVLSLLWLPEDLYIHIAPAGRHLIDARDLFATKAVYQPFRGYAQGQLRKMHADTFAGYMGAKRKALVEQHGYDTKSAAHLIRLLRQGCEFLLTGEMEVQRGDAAELTAIKHGKWPLSTVRAEAQVLDARLTEAYECSPLPEHPDRRAVNQLAESVVGEALGI